MSGLRYAKAGNVHIAYDVRGDGPVDLVVTFGHLLPLESIDDDPVFARLLDRLSRFARVIVFDRRGIGLSDPAPPDDPPTIEHWTQDLVAVLDDVGTSTVALIGLDIRSSQVATVAAATRPERVSALVLVHPAARITRAPDYDFGIGPDTAQRLVEDAVATVSDASVSVSSWLPSRVGDARFEGWLHRWQRRGGSPGMIAALWNAFLETDIRPVLASVRCPTLVLQRPAAVDVLSDQRHARAFAEGIAGARYREIPGTDHFGFSGDVDAIADEAEAFLTGAPPSSADIDRVFAAVLFTDIIDSTPRAAELGDRRWRETLDAHDGAVRRELDRSRGTLVKCTGDGILAIFDGPARAVTCASSIARAVGALGVDIRAGLHAGEVSRRGEDITGIAVNIARRVCDAGQGTEILVSRTVVDLVAGSEIRFEDRGEQHLKGIQGDWRLFAVLS